MPVVKYDRKGFKPRPRQILLTTSAIYLVEEAKIKQRVVYTSLKGSGSITTLPEMWLDGFRSFFFCISSHCYCMKYRRPLRFVSGVSVSNLTDDIIVLHITCENAKQKVFLIRLEFI